MLILQSPVPPFSASYAPDDRAMADRLLRAVRLDRAQEARIDRTATRLIEAIRANDDPLGGVEDMLREFALSTKEGLALMLLAEALLRVPDAATQDRLIEDKLGSGDWEVPPGTARAGSSRRPPGRLGSVSVSSIPARLRRGSSAVSPSGSASPADPSRRRAT